MGDSNVHVLTFGSGDRMLIASHQELSLEENQAVLRRNIRARGRCSCSSASFTVVFRGNASVCYCRRDSISDFYADDCPLKLEYALESGKPVYSPGIFDPPVEQIVHPAGFETTTVDLRYEDFVHYCNRIISESSALSLNVACGTDGNRPALRMPSTITLMREVWRCFKRKWFTSKITGFDAARQGGYSLLFGLTGSDIPDWARQDIHEPRHVILQDCYTWERAIKHVDLLLPYSIKEQVVRRFAIWRHGVIPPPYFFIAVTTLHDRVHTAVRLFLYPVALLPEEKDSPIVFIESQLERRFAQIGMQTGRVFLKPVRLDSMEGLSSFLLVNSLPPVLPYRPDFICFGDTPHIIEVLGFNDAPYFEHIRKKGNAYKALGYRFAQVKPPAVHQGLPWPD